MEYYPIPNPQSPFRKIIILKLLQKSFIFIYNNTTYKNKIIKN